MTEGTSGAEPLGTAQAPIPPWWDRGAAAGQAAGSDVSSCGGMKGWERSAELSAAWIRSTSISDAK